MKDQKNNKIVEAKNDAKVSVSFRLPVVTIEAIKTNMQAEDLHTMTDSIIDLITEGMVSKGQKIA